MRALLGNEPSYGLRLDRRKINAVITKLLQEETADDVPAETPRCRCQTAYLVHVHVEPTERLVDRCRCRHPLRDHGIGPQDHQKMAERDLKPCARVYGRSRTPAMG
jgi:hypothetical protein